MKRITKRLINFDFCIEHPDRKVEAWHHIVPSSFGGTYVVPLCSECHSIVHFQNRTELINHSILIKAGLERAKLLGKKCGRPSVLDIETVNLIKMKYEKLKSIRRVAKDLNVSKTTVERALKK